jgi:hypothetical protein
VLGTDKGRNDKRRMRDSQRCNEKDIGTQQEESLGKMGGVVVLRGDACSSMMAGRRGERHQAGTVRAAKFGTSPEAGKLWILPIGALFMPQA